MAVEDRHVVALIPSKDGATEIAETVAALLADDIISEVVVIDDGSTDHTSNAARDAGARVVRLPVNAGKAAALKAGIEATPQATTYLLVDADTKETAAQAIHLLPPVLDNEAQLVIGVLPSARGRGGFGLVRDTARVGIQRACGLEARAPLSGQRAIDAKLLRSLQLAPRFGVEVGMTIDAVRAGAIVVERDVSMEHRHHGKTAAGFRHRAKQGWDVLRALRPRILSGAFRLGLLIATTTFCLGLLLSRSTQEPTAVPTLKKQQVLPHAQTVQVIVVPNWSWDNVSVHDNTVVAYDGLEQILDPSQPAVLGSVATGKVEDIVRAVSLGTRDETRTETSDVRVSVRPLGLTRSDQGFADVRIVMGVTLQDQRPELRPIVLQGAGVNGSFVSNSTKRTGIVDLTDIASTVRQMQGEAVPADSAEPLRFIANQTALVDAAQTAASTDFYDRLQGKFNLIYIAAQTVIYALVFFYRKRMRFQRFVPALAALIAGVPVAALVTQWCFLHQTPRLGPWSASFALILVMIMGMSAVASRGSTMPLRRVLVATMVVLTFDVIGNDTLQLGGLFGSTPSLGARYYGFGNVASVLLMLATLLWCALHVKAGAAVGTYARRSAWWRSLSVAAIVTIVIGTPGLGSDVGGLFASLVTFAAFFYALWTGSLPLRRLAIGIVGAVVALCIAAVVDAQRAVPNRTHLGRLAAQVGNEGLRPLTDTIVRKVELNLFGYAFPFSFVMLAAALTVIVLLLRSRWDTTLPLRSPERIAVIAAIGGSLLAYGVNDSGIVVLALVFVFLGPFVMVSNRLNRWDAPKLEVVVP